MEKDSEVDPLTLGLLLGADFDLVQSSNSSWTVDRLVIPEKIFGVLPVDNLLAYFLMTLLATGFYEYFWGTSGPSNPPKRFYLMSLFVLTVTSITFLIYSFWPIALRVPYAYLVGGLFAAAITAFGIYRRPNLLDPSLRMSAFFSFVWFGAEIAALHTKAWTFTGQYIGSVTVFGVSFPFEELFFWMFWYAPFLVVTYKYLMRPEELQSAKSAFVKHWNCI